MKVTTREIKAENEATELAERVNELDRALAMAEERIKCLHIAADSAIKKYEKTLEALAAERIKNAVQAGQIEALKAKLQEAKSHERNV